MILLFLFNLFTCFQIGKPLFVVQRYEENGRTRKEMAFFFGEFTFLSYLCKDKKL